MSALSRSGTPLPYDPEPQGEAIAFRTDGKGYYTLSEQALGLPVHLNYARKLTSPEIWKIEAQK